MFLKHFQFFSVFLIYFSLLEFCLLPKVFGFGCEHFRMANLKSQIMNKVQLHRKAESAENKSEP